MILRLDRFCSSEMGVFGRLMGPSFSCYTAERPWLNNEPYISCVPDGVYSLKHCRFNRGGYDTVEIAGVPGRSHILIHRGNLPRRHAQGCVLVGRQLGCLGGQWAVLESAKAFDAFWQSMREQLPGEIEIRWRMP